jgi:hypothetical protein
MTLNILNDISSVQTIENDSSTLFCLSKQEEQSQIISVVNKKLEKKTASYPFGKW